MNYKKDTLQKTAALTAVFCFLWSLNLHSAVAKVSSDSSLEIVKKKAINLLMQSQKKQAIAVLTDYISVATSKLLIKDAQEYRLKIAKNFLTKETQEFYEMSLNLTIEEPKASRKNNEECLNKDPENLECQIQKARLLCRERKKPLKPEELEIFARYFETSEINWIKISCEKNLANFKSYVFLKKDLNKTNENKFVLAVLEVERSLSVNNFSKAKEVLSYIESENSDWPDLVYFKNKIDNESTENKSVSAVDSLNQYKNKCKNLSKSVARKYKYDFDLCLRGL